MTFRRKILNIYITYISSYSSARQTGDCFIILNLLIKELHPVPTYSFEFPIHFFEMKQEEEKQ